MKNKKKQSFTSLVSCQLHDVRKGVSFRLYRVEHSSQNGVYVGKK